MGEMMGGFPPPPTKKMESAVETLEQKKVRLNAIWGDWKAIKNNPELNSLFDRKDTTLPEGKPQEILKQNGYPDRTKIAELQFEKWKVNLNPKFIKDGYAYLLRGDHPNLEGKGFYSRMYGFGKQNTKELASKLTASTEAGYVLYGDERFLAKTEEDVSSSSAEQLAYLQSEIGGSSFVSTTTSILCAEAGTGNVPDAAEQLEYEIYVLKIPVDSVINSNTGNYFGMEEDEYLVPDYIGQSEIVAKFPRSDKEGVYQYLHSILGITRADVRLAHKE